MMCWWAVFFIAGAMYGPGQVYLSLLVSIALLFGFTDLLSSRSQDGSTGLTRPSRQAGVRPALLCVSGLIIMSTVWHNAPCLKLSDREVPTDPVHEKRIEANGSPESIDFERLKDLPAVLNRWIGSRIDHHPLSMRTRKLMKALVLADRSGVKGRLIEEYSYVGIAHFLALSGLHLGVISVAFERGIRIFFGKVGFIDFLLLCFLGIYSSAAGSPPSLVRALALMTTFRIASAICLRLTLGQGLIAGSFILLSIRPSYLLETGFQLSFMAVAGIAYLGLPALELIREHTRTGRIIGWFVTLLIITFSVQAFTMPLTVELFGRVPLLAAGANILMSIPVVLMLYLSVMYIAIPFEMVRELLSSSLNLIAGFLSVVPSRINIIGRPCILSGEVEYLTYSASITLLCLALSGRSTPRKTLTACAILLLVASFVCSESCHRIPGNGARIQVSQEAEILNGDPVIILVPGRLDRYAAVRAVRMFWSAGYRSAGFVVVRSSDARDLYGLKHLISRTGEPKVICSPYLCIEGVTAAQAVPGGEVEESVVENEEYLVRYWIPAFPPPEGSITSAEAACLHFQVEKKKGCKR